MQAKLRTVTACSAVGALGVLTGLALGSGHTPAAIDARAKQPVEVRTQVIRRTVHVYRHAKPQPVAAGSGRAPGGARLPAAAPSSRASGAPGSASAAGPPAAPVTRASGAAGAPRAAGSPAAPVSRASGVHSGSGSAPAGPVRTHSSGAASSPSAGVKTRASGGHGDGGRRDD